MNEKVRVNISITRETHLAMKKMAAVQETTVSQLITELVRHSAPPLSSGADHDWAKKLSADTVERIKQYAYENHSTPEQVITDWVWKQKVTYENLRGQISLF